MFLIGDNFINKYILVFYKQNEKWGIMSAKGNVLCNAFADEIIAPFKVWVKNKKKYVPNYYVLAKINGKGVIVNLYGDVVLADVKINKKPFYIIEKYEKKVESIQRKKGEFSDEEINQVKMLENEMFSMGSIDGMEYRCSKDNRSLVNPMAKVKCAFGKVGLEVDNEIVVPLVFDSIGNFNKYGFAAYVMGKWKGVVTPFGLVIPDKDLRYGNLANRGFYDTCGRLDAMYMEGRLQEASSGWDRLRKMMKKWKIKMPEAEDLLYQRLLEVNYDIEKQQNEERQKKVWAGISSILSTANEFVISLNSMIDDYSKTDRSIFEEKSAVNALRNANNSKESNTKWMQANYQTQKAVYGNYESQLSKMKINYPDNYDNSQRIDIQRKMKNIREIILSHGGTCNISPMETWKP